MTPSSMGAVRGLATAAVLAACCATACGGDAASADVDAGAVACPPTRVVGSEENPESSDAVPQQAAAAANVLTAYCGPCHTPSGAERVADGPSNVADFNAMIDEGFVIDCSAERSPIITSIRRNEMPPPDRFPVTAPDLDVVAQYIEFLCSDEEKACARRPSSPGCDDVLSARQQTRCAW